MISLISEITDGKGRRAARGWVCFDRDCPGCARLARRFRASLESRGYALAVLQDPRVKAQLSLAPDQLLVEMRVLVAEGRQFAGADALIYLAGKIWWAWPLWGLAHLPGMRRAMRAAYRWVAARRSCAPAATSLRPIAMRTSDANFRNGRQL